MIKPPSGSQPVYDESFIQFLQRAESMISSQLMKNMSSKAFIGYDVNWETPKQAMACTHTLINTQAQVDHCCTDLAWSISGSTIAASYGRYDHSDWCHHPGWVCIWNLAVRDFDPMRPHTTIESTVIRFM